MEEINLKIACILMALTLIIGCVAGAVFFPREKVKEVPVEKEVIKEVPTEIEVEKIVEVPMDEKLLDYAIDEVMKYLDDEEMLVCDGDEYDADEVEISKIYDDWCISYEEDDYTVAGALKLKFKESDQKSCRETYNFEVFYEDGEEPEVAIL